MKKTTRCMSAILAACIGLGGMVQTAQATLISTEQVAASQGVHSATAQREQLNATLARADRQRRRAQIAARHALDLR